MSSRQLGKVKWYSVRKGYGFVAPENGGDDIFIHRTSFEAPKEQEEGKGNNNRVVVRGDQEIEFSVGNKDGKPIALSITAKNNEPLPAVPKRRNPKKSTPATQQTTGKTKKPKGQGALKLKAYLDPRSTCSRQVLLALTEKDLKFDVEIVNLAKGEQKSEAHLARQPFGQVPFLEIQNKWTRPLFESVAICHYIASFESGEKLVPEDGWNNAVMQKMIAIINESFWPAIKPAYVETVLKKRKDPKAKPDKKKVEAACAAVVPILAIIEKEMRSSQYLAGRQFTLADVTAIPYFAAIESSGCGHVIKNCPKLTQWWADVSARDAWKATLQFSNGM